MPKARSKREAKRLTDQAPDTKSKRPSKATSKATSNSTSKATSNSTLKSTSKPPTKPTTHTTKTIILYCPSLDITNRITFPTTQPPSTILRAILSALSLTVGFAYDLHHRPITSYKNLQHDQTVLVATCYFECPLAEKKRHVLIAQPGPAEKAWERLGVEERKAYIQERRESGHGDDAGEVVRLTLPITAALERFKDAQTTSSSTTVEAHLATIQEHWGLPLDAVLGLRGMYMPCEELEKWEDGLLGMLAVLSEATVGQADLVAGWVVAKMREKKADAGGGKEKTGEDQGKTVEKGDVEEVGRGLYREALG